MKTKILAIFMFSAFLFLNSCSKDEDEKEEPVAEKVTYLNNIKPLLTASCAPCHVSGGINPNKFDNYDTAKSKITGILDRVQRASTAPGFMPQGEAKLSAENIALLKKWMDDGLLEN